MVNRGFGLQKETTYAQEVTKASFNPAWWNQADDVNFKLNDDAVTRSGGSRMNKRARAGVMKPTGSTKADADLQQLGWYFFGYLDNYKYTGGAANATTHTHEFWGGEGRTLPSFRGIAVYDMLKKYLYGLIEDQLKLEVSNEAMTVGAEWIYATEKAGIIGEDSETFTQPAALTNEEIFIMFYDVDLYLGTNNGSPKKLTGVSTAFSFEGSNNHNVDSAIGLGSRYPQQQPLAGKRDNKISITTTLTAETVREILNGEYGEVDALEPSSCKLLQLPLEVNIAHCENANISCRIKFPKCNIKVEYDMSGADVIEATISLDTLGTETIKLADNTTDITTDMYVKLVNNQTSL